MRVKPAVPAFDRLVTSGRRLTESWAGSPRAVDVLTALGCLGLMALDLPGLAAADNSLTGPTAAVVLTLGCATCWCAAGSPGSRTWPRCSSSGGCTSSP